MLVVCINLKGRLQQLLHPLRCIWCGDIKVW